MAELLLQEHGTISAAAPPPPTPEQLQHEAEEVARELSRERRRSSIGGLALPSGSASDQQHQLNASINIGAAQVEFEAQGVKINSDGLFINGENVSEVHQDDLAVLSELGRGACSVVKKAQVCGFTLVSYLSLGEQVVKTVYCEKSPVACTCTDSTDCSAEMLGMFFRRGSSLED